eukprot:8209605-Alexandrium_andersonii.AAC.1
MEQAILAKSRLLEGMGYKPALGKVLAWRLSGAPANSPDWLTEAWSAAGVVLVGSAQAAAAASSFTAGPFAWAGAA